MNANKKYRSEFIWFKTPQGRKIIKIVILAGEKERFRLIQKAERLASEKGWKVC